MSLPQSVRVKLSSEAADSISITPVVIRDIPIHELIEHMLGVTGKDGPRIRELLLRGTLVSGASRFRWTGWAADPDGLREVLATFPDPDPSRLFAPERCVRAILRGGRQTIEIPRDAVARKGLFRKETFWDLLMGVVAAGTVYSGYSYRERADRFVSQLTVVDTERLRAGSSLISYSTLKDQIHSVGFTHVELYVTR